MLNKGQVTIGLLVVVFMMVIVGVALLLPIASNVEGTRTTGVANSTITAPAADVTIEIEGSGIIGTAVVINETGFTLPASNFTILGRQAPITSGVVTNTYTSTDSTHDGQSLNLSYTSEPDGFITDAGGRALIFLVIILSALAIGVIAIIPAARSGVMEMFGR